MRLVLEGYTGGVSIGGRRLTNLRYADDIILIAGSASELQELVARMQSASTEMGLRINVKTTVMSLNTDEKPEVSIYGERVQTVDSFKYLGVIFTEEASGTMEFQARLNLGYAKLATLKPMLQRKDVPATLKARLIQAIVFPVVTYGCEAWSLTKDERSKLRAFETKSYRRALGIRYTDRVTNEEVFARTGCEAMLETQVRRRKLRYFGHVVRHESLEQDIMLGMVPGTKRQGGQKRQWIDDICNWATMSGSVTPLPNGRTPKALSKTVSLARDREVWRCAVHDFANPAHRVG